MVKEEIINRHKISHDAFVDYVLSLDEADYNYRHNNEKWDAGQQLDHISRTVRVLAKAAGAPKFILKYKFGKANRPSRTFDEIVSRYSEGIKAGFKANGKFIPSEITFIDRQQRLDKLIIMARNIENKIGKYSEKSLDTVILPHPAMGILTMREIMYFTIHHIEDHLSQMKRNLSWRG